VSEVASKSYFEDGDEEDEEDDSGAESEGDDHDECGSDTCVYTSPNGFVRDEDIESARRSLAARGIVVDSKSQCWGLMTREVLGGL